MHNSIESDFKQCLRLPDEMNLDKFIKTHKDGLEFLVKKLTKRDWNTRYVASLLIYRGYDNPIVVEPIISSMKKYKNFDDRIGYIFTQILARYKTQKVSQFASDAMKKIKNLSVRESWERSML